MSITGRTERASEPGALAGAVREADFVSIVAAADGDALAAAGLLARGCRTAGVPFQASVARTAAKRERRLASDADALTVAVGADATGAAAGADHVLAGDGPASVVAHEVATELGADPEPVLALAGSFAAGVKPGAGPTAPLLEAARSAGAVERRPGVALPVDDVADGLVHQTLVHGPFAGRPDEAAALAADAGFDPATAEPEADWEADAHRELASLVALEAAGAEDATARTADAVEWALRPYATPGGPFATVGGHADVLDAVARTAPGTGVALALAGGAREAALSAWRDRGRAAHEAVRSATTARYDGLLVVRLEGDAPVEAVARLVLAARSPEPAVLAVSEDETAVAAAPDAAIDPTGVLAAAVETVGGSAAGNATRAYARHDAEPGDLIEAVREADT